MSIIFWYIRQLLHWRTISFHWTSDPKIGDHSEKLRSVSPEHPMLFPDKYRRYRNHWQWPFFRCQPGESDPALMYWPFHRCEQFSFTIAKMSIGNLAIVKEVAKNGNLGFPAGNLDFSATSNGAACHINDRLSDNHKTTILRPNAVT